MNSILAARSNENTMLCRSSNQGSPNALTQARPRSSLEIANLQLHIPSALPLIDLRRKCQTAFARIRHQLLHALGHAESDGPELRALLPHTETYMSLAATDPGRFSNHLQIASEEKRLRIACAIRLQLGHRIDQFEG